MINYRVAPVFIFFTLSLFSSVHCDLFSSPEEVQEDPEDFDRDLIKAEWWHLDKDGKQAGPFKFDTMKHFFFKQNISLYTLVWTPEFDEWKPLRNVPGIKTGLSEGRGYKERLQLFAIDENTFVRELRKAERDIPDMGSEAQNEMFCARTGAVGEVLRRAVVKKLLKEVLKDLRAAEAEKTKLLKSIKATKFKLAQFEAESNVTLFQKRKNAVILQKKTALFWNKMQELKKQESNFTMVGLWESLVAESVDLVQDEDTRLWAFAAVGFPVLAILYTCCSSPGSKRPRAKPKPKAKATGERPADEVKQAKRD